MISGQTNTPIVPRFEFRIFGRDLDPIHEKLKTISTNTFFDQHPIHSPEYYLLSGNNDTTNCKIRNSKIDIKNLLIEEDELEKWTVHLKAAFPLYRRQIVKEVFPALWTRAPLLKDGYYDLNQFIDIVLKHDDIQVLSIEKIRLKYQLDKAFCEYARVFVNGAEVKTIAIESEEKNKVLECIERLGIASWENLNYPKALKRIIGWDGLKKID